MNTLPKNMLHIGFTGGPFCGKTKTFSAIQKEFANIYKDSNIEFLYAPEAATAILEEDPSLSNKGLSFQLKVMNHQMTSIEKAIEFAIENPEKLCILISDRTILDGLMYLTEEECRLFNFDLLSKYYTRVVCFDFHSSFLRDAQARGSNKVRKEQSAEEFQVLADKLYEIAKLDWLTKKVLWVNPCDTLQRKQEYVRDMLIDWVITPASRNFFAKEKK